jgi:hypothetical protein
MFIALLVVVCGRYAHTGERANAGSKLPGRSWPWSLVLVGQLPANAGSKLSGQEHRKNEGEYVITLIVIALIIGLIALLTLAILPLYRSKPADTISNPSDTFNYSLTDTPEGR